MDIAAIHANVQQGLSPVQSPPAEQVQDRRDLIQAVRAVNASEMFGQDNELTFVLDRETKRTVVRIVSRKTGEVVQQIPPEYVLRIAEQIKEG